MPDARNRFAPLEPQSLIQPLESEEEANEEGSAPKGAVRRFMDGTLFLCGEIVRGLAPYLIASGVLILAIAVFFGVSVKAAILLLGLGAVGLGVFFAATQGS